MTEQGLPEAASLESITRDETQVPHVHVHSYARDCDGPHEYHCTKRANRNDWESAIYIGSSLTPMDVVRGMIEREIGSAVGTYISNTFHVTVRELDDTIEVDVCADARESDEGSSSLHFVGCVDPSCAGEGSYVRDVYAEAAGY